MKMDQYFLYSLSVYLPVPIKFFITHCRLIALQSWMDIATISKLPSADRPELAHSSLKHHGGLTASVIKSL